ncbi:MAG: CDP-diacylglycerol--glycerol-3-phosphate 3-phosphatidyltransferase [Opitutales bacterium]|nr:CDP-diacylglycerol--glycerol-3-phosphate 3-phosphatidyltransferase [Opitutales bacterium]
MNWPNILTMSRIPMIFVIGGLFYSSFPGAKTIAFFLYVLAGITDWMDGYLARKYQQTSDLGKLMDALNDKIFTVGMFLLLTGKNLIPTWGIFCILCILCREFFITGLRVLLAKNGVVMAAEKLGKFKTILQIVVIGSFFLIEMLRIDATSWFPTNGLVLLTQINQVNFLLTTLLTLHSGCRYLCKYYPSLHEKALPSSTKNANLNACKGFESGSIRSIKNGH